MGLSPVKELVPLRLARPFPLLAALAAALAVSALAGAAARKAPLPKPPPAAPAGNAQASSAPPWLRVDYGALVDRRKLTHSGEPVGVLLNRLGGRSFPAPGERADDALAFRLLDPVLEPYAFVLIDALDSVAPPHDPPFVEVGALWEAGEAQPAWAELCRARAYVLESDGEGRLRAILPSATLAALPYDDALPAGDPVAAAKGAWDDAWPVLRHALAAERRRLTRIRGGLPQTLDVEVHAYRHLPSKSAFVLGAQAYRAQVSDTAATGGRAPLDLAAMRSILERGLTIEGGRLEPGGTLRWLTSEGKAKPSLLGRAPELSDLAVAYRAVARGGLGEPYMSLDRAPAPHRADVNYGGRLRDTALGMVSLLSDVRFKTFSVGIDLLGAGDVRGQIRKTLPEFRTHLERFATDPAAGAVLDQQTRFWFYPDDVDLTVSADFDLLAFRKARMTAASERVQDAGAPKTEPAWTRDTVSFLNARHDALRSLFPEIAELDTSARFLALFTWLDAAKSRGLAVPDLDILLALDLPAVPTPRHFPELLSYDVLPPPKQGDEVEVLDRTTIGEALERLAPPGGQPLSPLRRFARAKGMLDRRVPDQAALLEEMSGAGDGAGDDTLDLLSYRAERLLMHARVLDTLEVEDAARVAARRGREPGIRVFSVGIGGIDLGMRAALARASRPGTAALSLGGGGLRRTAPPSPPSVPAASPAAAAPPPVDPPLLPPTELPDHGLGPESARTTVPLAESRGAVVFRRLPGAGVARGSWRQEDGKTISWQDVELNADGPEARGRRLVSEPDGTGPAFQRVEEGRRLAYRFERDAVTLRAALQTVPLPPGIPARSFGNPEPTIASPAPEIPEGLALLTSGATDGTAPAAPTDPPTVRLRIRGAGGRDVSAEFPRGVLQRLVLGREADRAADRPLPGFTPPRQVLAGAGTLMVLEGDAEARPGEEDAARLARALDLWWGADPASSGAHAVVGTDAAASPARWSRAPRLGGSVSLLAPAEAFPARSASLRARVSSAAGDGMPPASTLLVVSAEPPGVLGRRLRLLSRDPGMEGKVLAVLSLGGALRADLPSSLLGEGRLSAFGVFEAGPLGLERAADEAAAWARAAASDAAKGRRLEELPGPFTWFY